MSESDHEHDATSAARIARVARCRDTGGRSTAASDARGVGNGLAPERIHAASSASPSANGLARMAGTGTTTRCRTRLRWFSGVAPRCALVHR